jgi:hypothetical protein
MANTMMMQMEMIKPLIVNFMVSSLFIAAREQTLGRAP